MGSTSLQEGDNKYCKESGACVRELIRARAAFDETQTQSDPSRTHPITPPPFPRYHTTHTSKTPHTQPIQLITTPPNSSPPPFPNPPNTTVKNVYASVDQAVQGEGLSIALSFEGRRNPSPPTLSKIQRGMFKFSQNYDLPCLLIRLQGIERIMPAEGLPSGALRCVWKVALWCVYGGWGWVWCAWVWS